MVMARRPPRLQIPPISAQSCPQARMAPSGARVATVRFGPAGNPPSLIALRAGSRNAAIGRARKARKAVKRSFLHNAGSKKHSKKYTTKALKWGGHSLVNEMLHLITLTREPWRGELLLGTYLIDANGFFHTGSPRCKLVLVGQPGKKQCPMGKYYIESAKKRRHPKTWCVRPPVPSFH